MSTWSRLGAGWSCDIVQSEETVTDINLLAIQMSHPALVRTRKFTRHAESRRSGADWEWWLGTPGHWVGIRVQAKKLDIGTERYKSLDHVSANGRQVDLLLRASQRESFWPMYCFYNYSANVMPQRWRVCGEPRVDELMGCAVSPAPAIEGAIRRGADRLVDIVPLSRPWSCLVCCKGHSRQELSFSRRTELVLRAMFGEAGASDFPQARETPPPYVRALLHDGAVDPTQQLPDVSHLLVVSSEGAEEL